LAQAILAQAILSQGLISRFRLCTEARSDMASTRMLLQGLRGLRARFSHPASRPTLARFVGASRGMSDAGLGEAVPSLTTTPKNAEGAKQLYDEWAGGYDDALQSWGYPAPRRVAEVLAEMGVGASQRVLDLGCGTGMSGAALLAAGIGKDGGLVGTDISQASLDIAMAKGFYASVVFANLDEPLPFDGATFDAVACVGVLSYVERFDVLFPELARVLRPGGVFVTTHREVLWDNDERECRSAASAVADRGIWSIERIGEPEAYMPKNPDPDERAKRIRVLGFRKC